MPATGVVSGFSPNVPNLIPGIAVILSAPQPILDGRAFLRIHTKASKLAAETVLKHFHAVHLPKRFVKSAKSIDQHKRRGPNYERKKRRQYGSSVDLVKRGRTRQRFTGVLPRVVHHRNTGEMQHSSIRLRFPFPVSRRWDKAQVTVEDMAAEIRTWRPQEAEEAAKLFGTVYTEELIQLLNAHPRLKMKAGDAVGALAQQYGVSI